MSSALIVKQTECKPYTAIGKNRKSIITAKQFRPLIPCVEPNQEIQIDFGVIFGVFFYEKGNEVIFLAALDHFPKYTTACIYEKANDPNVMEFLDMYNENHGVPRSIQLDPAKCPVGNQVKTFCNKNNIEIFEAPVNNHHAIGLVERLLQTIKNRLAFTENENVANNSFHVKRAIKIFIHQLRIYKEKTKITSPF